MDDGYSAKPQQHANALSPCCARAESGHAAAAPPSSVMKSRRSLDHLVGERHRHARNALKRWRFARECPTASN
jgi:hypothetical protein